MTQLKFFIIFLLIATQVSATTNVLITGTFTARPFPEIPLTQLGLHYGTPQKIDLVAVVDKNRHFTFAFNISSAGFYRLGDGLFGHIIFIQPGDTIAVTLTPYPEKDITTGTPFHRTFNKMTVRSYNPVQVSFMDEMSIKTGFPVKFKPGKETSQQFKNRCDSALSIANRLLNQYIGKGSVSDTFAYYAKAEINSQYILNLCNSLYFISKDKLPLNFFNQIPVVDFNDENIAGKTDSYITAVSVYNVYVANDFDTHIQTYSNLTGEFGWAYKELTGIIRDRILSWIMDDYKDKGFASYDSLYRLYLSVCKTTSLKNTTIAEIDHYRQSEKMQDVSFSEVLGKTKVIDIKGDTMLLADILNNDKISVIDFWATWCKPCLLSKPSYEKAASKYKGKISFISISTDSNYDKWKVFPKKNSSAEEYYLIDNFTSPLILFLKVETIPRYVSISKSKSKVIDDNMIRPEFESDFNRVIVSYIQQE